MFLKIPKHTHLCYKMAIFNNFDYFVILPISYKFSKFPKVFQSTYKSSERRRALAPPTISSLMPSETVTYKINFWTHQSQLTLGNTLDTANHIWTFIPIMLCVPEAPRIQNHLSFEFNNGGIVCWSILKLNKPIQFRCDKVYIGGEQRRCRVLSSGLKWTFFEHSRIQRRAFKGKGIQCGRVRGLSIRWRTATKNLASYYSKEVWLGLVRLWKVRLGYGGWSPRFRKLPIRGVREAEPPGLGHFL